MSKREGLEQASDVVQVEGRLHVCYDVIQKGRELLVRHRDLGHADQQLRRKSRVSQVILVEELQSFYYQLPVLLPQVRLRSC